MADARAIDAASRRTIREELAANILVEAGAGSGKTQMLAERMAAGIAAGVYQVEHIAAVTFTRKAASELRGRFHLALEHELATARAAQRPGDANQAARLARIEAARGCCASGRSSLACRPASPSSTRCRICNCAAGCGASS
jgi:ATP-dependent helicase/nuclease subunit A